MKNHLTMLLIVLGFVFALIALWDYCDQDRCDQCEGSSDCSFWLVSIICFFAAFIAYNVTKIEVLP